MDEYRALHLDALGLGQSHGLGHDDERRLWFTKKRVEAVDEAPGLQRLGILPHRQDVAEASRMTEELLYR